MATKRKKPTKRKVKRKKRLSRVSKMYSRTRRSIPAVGIGGH